MNRNNRLKTKLLAAGLLLAASPLAFADGTSAGQPISNTATVNFTVGGNPQTLQEDSTAFVVDRLVTFSVVKQADATVTPNAPNQALQFLVTNTSNDELDFALSVEQPTTDDFDATSIRYFRESEASPNGYDASDIEITSIDDLAADASVTIYVVGNIPMNVTQGNTSDVILVATATDDAGDALVPDTDGNDPATIENVFGDEVGTATGDGDNDGVHSATGTYTVNSANISVSKAMAVLSDPTGGVYPNAYPVPGASILYCITVSNGAGAQTASNVIVSDPIPEFTSYAAGTIRTAASAVACTDAAWTSATVVPDTADVATAGGGLVPAFDSSAGDQGTVTTNNGAVAASGATTTMFKVTVD